MAAEISSRVLNMVRRRILEDPTVTNDVLFAAATEMEPDLQHLDMRQFNARYPLRVRRWELSERTRILQPSGPLSKAAAANPTTPVSPRPLLTLAVRDESDGSTASQAKGIASQTQGAASRSQTSAAAGPTQVATPSLQARINAPRPAAAPLAPAKPPSPAVSQTLRPHLETQPGPQDEPAEPGPETTLAVRTQTPATRPTRRRRTTRRPAEDARAEVIMVMLRWATAIGQAGGIPEVFATLSTVDDYVDRIATVLDIR